MSKRKLTKKGKSGNLRQQFNYYVKRYKETRIKEYALSKAVGNITSPSSLYNKSNLDYDTLKEKGLKRFVTNPDFKRVIINIEGEKAIRTQIQSLANYTNKNHRIQEYINNYRSSLEKAGMHPSDINSIINKMERTSISKLNYLIEAGILPSITYIYSKDDDGGLSELNHEINWALDSVKSGEGLTKYKKLVEKAKKYEGVSEIEFELEGIFI